MMRKRRGYAGGGPVTYLKPEYSKDQLMGSGLQNRIDSADGDSDLQSIIHSLRYHGLSVPSSLSDVPGYRKGGRVQKVIAPKRVKAKGKK